MLSSGSRRSVSCFVPQLITQAGTDLCLQRTCLPLELSIDLEHYGYNSREAEYSATILKPSTLASPGTLRAALGFLAERPSSLSGPEVRPQESSRELLCRKHHHSPWPSGPQLRGREAGGSREVASLHDPKATSLQQLWWRNAACAPQLFADGSQMIHPSSRRLFTAQHALIRGTNETVAEANSLLQVQEPPAAFCTRGTVPP